jgi:hypothetical protein
LKRFHTCAAWLAIVALLIDGLLPTTVSAAANRNAVIPLALCGTAAGSSLPAKHAPTVPTRHCALCAAMIVGVIPGRHGGVAAPLFVGAVHPAINPSVTIQTRCVDYESALPRAPPLTTS